MTASPQHPPKLLLLAAASLLAFQAIATGQGMPTGPAQPIQTPAGLQQQGFGSQPVAPPAPVADPGRFTPADRDKVLDVGDQLTFEIVEDRAEALPRRVTDAGELDIPYIGRVRAAGRSVSQVAAEIKSRLEAEYYYTATVRLALDQVNRLAAMGRIYVSGEVRAPGPQDIYSGDRATVGAAILRAGSFNQFADKRKVKVVRKGPDGASTTIEVDLKAILEEGRVEKDIPLRDGDYVIVPKRLINF